MLGISWFWLAGAVYLSQFPAYVRFLLGGAVGLVDYYLLPSTYAFGFAPEAKAMYADFPAVQEWQERMEALPTVQRFRAAQPPRGPIEHARKWAVSHRPKY